MKEAEEAEKSGGLITCRAIVNTVIDFGIEDQDKKATFTADAQAAVERGAIETARVIYNHAIKVFPAKKGIWRRAALFEKEYGTT